MPSGKLRLSKIAHDLSRRPRPGMETGDGPPASPRYHPTAGPGQGGPKPGRCTATLPPPAVLRRPCGNAASTIPSQENARQRCLFLPFSGGLAEMQPARYPARKMHGNAASSYRSQVALRKCSQHDTQPGRYAATLPLPPALRWPCGNAASTIPGQENTRQRCLFLPFSGGLAEMRTARYPARKMHGNAASSSRSQTTLRKCRPLESRTNCTTSPAT